VNPTVLNQVEIVRSKFNEITSHLNERSRRMWSAVEAKSLGRGGTEIVHQATRIARNTIRAGLTEISKGKSQLSVNRIRHEGGGRKKKKDQEPKLLTDLEKLVEPVTRGDPESPLRWTAKSTRILAEELQAKGHQASHAFVGHTLRELGYSLQANRKSKEGGDHPDRNAQFLHINAKVKKTINHNNPVISVDTKKKENIGHFKNNGQEYCPKGKPTEVNVYDFIDKKLGKIAPYGVYDIDKNKGWVNVGISSDTAEFAVESIRTWWQEMGKKIYPQSKELLITADCGGSNSYRTRLWKVELQKLANETGLTIHVSHFPPGTSKWNKIEHRMFSFISRNWRGRPLVDRATAINLISNTKTKEGLEIRARLDENLYEKGRKVSDQEMLKINLSRDDFHGEWNYSIAPQIN